MCLFCAYCSWIVTSVPNMNKPVVHLQHFLHFLPKVVLQNSLFKCRTLLFWAGIAVPSALNSGSLCQILVSPGGDPLTGGGLLVYSCLCQQ